MNRISTWLFLVTISLQFLSCSSTSIDKNKFKVQSQHIAVGKELAISSDGRATAAIARTVYEAGGNWADVFVASSFAISVERPQSTGIGGGGFALVHVAEEKKTYAFDFREAAPAKLQRAYKDLLGPDAKRISALSSKSAKGSGTPGLVSGLFLIHSKWGKLKWADVVAPAISLARNGFKVDSLLAQAIQLAQEKIQADPELKKLFFVNSKYLVEGDPFRQEDLARSLESIAKLGEKEFYSGSLAQKIVAWSKESGGYLEAKDLNQYKTLQRQALEWSNSQHRYVGFPFPSFGGEATQMIQSKQDAFKDLSDKARAKLWVSTLEEVFSQRQRKYEQASDSPQTSHLSLVDAKGNAVASTQTINSTFGSGKVVPGTGIIMNDEMDDFYYEDSASKNHPINTPRPLSSMSPVLVFQNNRVVLATGSQGGRRLISCVNWVLLRKFGLNETLEEAVSSPRIHVAFPNKTLVADTTTPRSWLKATANYKVEAPPVDCRVQSVEANPAEGTLKSVVDPRSTGYPVAF